jgi:hypothetical protein
VVTLNVYAAGLVALYAAGLYHAVQAAEAAGTLTLACDGMKTTQPSVPDPKPDAVSMGITLDFTARRVDGFGSDAGLRIQEGSPMVERRGPGPAGPLIDRRVAATRSGCRGPYGDTAHTPIGQWQDPRQRFRCCWHGT